jgi:NAD(P)-dependent dehydrogenase (short-subunit alcohol dehydrogenase family)
LTPQTPLPFFTTLQQDPVITARRLRVRKGKRRGVTAPRNLFSGFPQTAAVHVSFTVVATLPPRSLGTYCGGMRVLLTGVSGYVGAALVPRLLDDGHTLRGYGRSAARVTAPVAEFVEGDAVLGTGLQAALHDVEVAYYLIHSMETIAQGTFAPRELSGRSWDIAGPDLLSYEQLIERIADAMLVSRPRISLGVNMTAVASVVAAAIAGEDAGLIGPLMESLEHDLLPRHDGAADAFGVRLHRFDAAVERALRDWESVEELAAR